MARQNDDNDNSENDNGNGNENENGNYQVIIRSFSHQNLRHFIKNESSSDLSHNDNDSSHDDDGTGDADDEGTEEEEEEVEVELKHKRSQKQRSLSFCDRLKVVLIPSREDYQSCGLLDTMWWQPGDYVYFKDDAKAEVFDVMKSKQLDSSEAIRYLYHEIQSSSEDTKTSFASLDTSSDESSCSPTLLGCEDSLPEFLEYSTQQHLRDQSDFLLPFSGLV